MRRGGGEGRAKRVKPLLLVLALQTLNCTQAKEQKQQRTFTPQGGGGGLVGWWLYKGRASILQPTDSQLLPREHQGDQSSSCRCIFSGCIINDYFCLFLIGSFASTGFCGPLPGRLNTWTSLGTIWLRRPWRCWLWTWSRCWPPSQGPV